MHQGNIGLFYNYETGEYAWLWRVYQPKSAKPVYIDVNTHEVFDEKDVDAAPNGDCRTVKVWTIKHEMDTLETLQYITFNMPQPEKFLVKANLRELQERVAKEREILRGLIKQHDELYDKANNVYERMNTVNAVIAKDEVEIQRLEAQWDGVYYYVYGKHKADDGQEYCWYADNDIGETIRPGDTIAVDTSRGRQLAIVTRVDKSRNYLAHKKVISNLSNTEERNGGKKVDAVPEAGEDTQAG